MPIFSNTKKNNIRIILQIILFVFDLNLFLDGYWGWGLLFLVILLFSVFNKYKWESIFKENLTSHNENTQTSQNEETAPMDELIIPETCPHCKSPNEKRIRLCEWCGLQII
jgi:hypothetical protein